jgi:hypothetical protein
VVFPCHSPRYREGALLVYLLTNTVNEKKYVGVTRQALAARWCAHVRKARRGARTALAQAIRQYGAHAFVVRVIGVAASWDEVCAQERAAIGAYQTCGPLGYNMTRG